MRNEDYEDDADNIQAFAGEVNRVAQRVEEPPELEEDQVHPLQEAKQKAPFPVGAPAIRRTAETEDLLNGLIAECHYLMREVALPSAVGTDWMQTRATFLGHAVDLANTGANVASAVAKLRIADRVGPEAQGRIIDAVAKTIVEAK